MERTEVIKALELHSHKAKPCLQDCPYGGLHYCGSEMAKDALSLIKELTEENERLRVENEQYRKATEKSAKRMQDKIMVECEEQIDKIKAELGGK